MPIIVIAAAASGIIRSEIFAISPFPLRWAAPMTTRPLRAMPINYGILIA
ncbi:MAG: hypothetical protein WA070_17575 [Sphingobium sp.]